VLTGASGLLPRMLAMLIIRRGSLMKSLMSMVSLTTLRLVGVVELSSGSSERSRHEPKCWLKFEDVVHCRDVKSLALARARVPS